MRAVGDRRYGKHHPLQLLKDQMGEVLLKIDVKTIYDCVQRGLIPYVKIQSNVRSSEQEISAWLEERAFHVPLCY
jgi:predicted DNA-binding transcriptional regulator AlpA